MILQHPNAKVIFDPPPSDPREQPVLTDDQIAVLDASEALVRLADSLGTYSRVARILRNVAAIHGEAI